MAEETSASSAVETIATREIGEFSQLVSERFAPLKVDADHPARFQGVMRGRRLGEIEIFDVRANQHQVERTQPVASLTPKRSYMVHLQLSGVGTIRQDGREAELQTGDIAFYDSDRAYSLNLDDQFRNAIMVFPQHMLSLPAEAANQLTATRIQGRKPVTSMVAPFIAQLATSLEALPTSSCLRLSRNAVDLISTMLHAELGQSLPDFDEPGRPASTINRARAYIDDNLANPELDPEQVAAAHFVSVRTLQMLFRKEVEMGVAEWIRTRRLELCREDLSSQLQDYLPVAAIAARRGFVNPPHFSRLFKSTFGETPSEYRLRTQLANV